MDDTVSVDAPAVASSAEMRGSSDRGAALRWATLVVGALAVVIGCLYAADIAVGYRVAASVVALGIAYVGLDRALRAWLGRPVETDLWLAGIWVAVLTAAAIFADVLPLSEAVDTSKTLSDPSRATPDLWSSHPFGTDSQALDVLGGVIYGARVSLQVSFLAVVVGTVVGGLVGISAGYFGGKIDAVVGVLTDSMLAFPPLILLLAVVTAVEPSVLTIALALAMLGIPTYTRLARANTLALAHREFVTAARTLGAGHGRIIMRELVPNVLRPLLSYSFIIIAVLIVAEASLSFLGVGIARPTPTWGNMISAGQGEMRTSPHLVFIPATVMFVTVYALNRLGDKARAHWSPQDSRL